MRILAVTIGLVIASFLLSFYTDSEIGGEVFGFVLSDVLIAALVLAVVWGCVVAISLREMCSMHLTQLSQKYRAGLNWSVWGVSLAVAWFVFLLILKSYIILNALRFE